MSIEMIHTTLLALSVAWAFVTTLLIFIWIYRSTLETREEDQLFLDSSGDMMAAEQREIVARIEKLSRPIITLAVVSGTLLIATAGVWIWESLARPTFS
jgi:hypothetical protein